MCLACSKKFNSNTQTGTSYNIKSSIDEKFVTHTLSVNDNSKDIYSYFEQNKAFVKDQLQHRMKSVNGALKWYLDINIKMKKISINDDEIIAEPFFRSRSQILINIDEFLHQFNDALTQIMLALTEFMRNGSGWVIEHILALSLYTAAFKPLSASSYIKTPKWISDTKSVINVQNTHDNKCFMWSVLAHLCESNCNKEKVCSYRKHITKLNMADITYPVSLKNIDSFEKNNPSISVNVFTPTDEKEILPLRISKHVYLRKEHVNLLLISESGQSHYCLIKDFSRLLNYRTKHNGRQYFCYNCLHSFTEEQKLLIHTDLCHQVQATKLPDEENNVHKFKDTHALMKVPFVIYADFESILSPIQNESKQKNTKQKNKKRKQKQKESYTLNKNIHEACGFAYKLVCNVNPNWSKETVVYRGKDAIEIFLDSLLKEQNYVAQKMQEAKVPMTITLEERQKLLLNANSCYMCRETLQQKVIDHDHFNGTILGVSCVTCNLKRRARLDAYNYRFFIPVFFHNFVGYDQHLLISKFGKYPKYNVSAIPKNSENFLSIDFGQFRFLDSLNFLQSKLSDLVETLKEGANDVQSTFKLMHNEFPDKEKFSLLLQKGEYPYSHMDSFSKFDEESLPNMPAFKNDLSGEDITEEQYKHAQEVWKTFSCKNMGDYHDIYLKTDCLLLADVFENFRDKLFEFYELDPCHYITLPGFGWSSMLRMTGVCLELITDPDMYLFLEKSLRGGISVISKRFAEANNQHLSNYNPDIESSYLFYIDCNNLYGVSLSDYLPKDGFYWLNEKEIDDFDVMTVSDTADQGYIIMCDLLYDSSLHDLHNQYPLAPEQLNITLDMLSPYAERLLHKFNFKPHPENYKLTPNLYNKQNYVLHYRNLKYYLKQGLKLQKIHRVLAFNQSNWMEPFIAFNTEKRRLSNAQFEKDIFKLLSNSCYGKSLENVRNHVNIKIVNNKKYAKKLIESTLFDSFTIINENLVIVKMLRGVVNLNKPIYAGFSVLELSKLHMYVMYYDVMKAKYGDKLDLMFTDTDSFLFHIKTENLYEDLKTIIQHFDTSNYPTEHSLYTKEREKKLGFFKDETASRPIKSFVGLRAKLYSFVYETDQNKYDEKKTCKGICKSVVKNNLTFEMYKNCLFEEKEIYNKMTVIKSKKQVLYTTQINKRSLIAFDDKRFLLDDGVNSLSYGHYSIVV